MKMTKKYFLENLNKGLVIINDDFLTTTLTPENSIDLIVTSSSCNIDIHYNSSKDNIPYEKYLDFTRKSLRRIFLTDNKNRILQAKLTKLNIWYMSK